MQIAFSWAELSQLLNHNFLYFFILNIPYSDSEFLNHKQGSSGRQRPRRPGSLNASFPKGVADVLVLVHDFRGCWATFWDSKEESQDGNKEL